MPVAIDTSVLITAEKEGDFERLLPEDENEPLDSDYDRLKHRLQILRPTERR